MAVLIAVMLVVRQSTRPAARSERQRFLAGLAGRPGVASASWTGPGRSDARVVVAAGATAAQVRALLGRARPTACCDATLRRGIATLEVQRRSDRDAVDLLLALGRVEADATIRVPTGSAAGDTTTVAMRPGPRTASFAAARDVVGVGGDLLHSLVVYGSDNQVSDYTLSASGLEVTRDRTRLARLLALAADPAFAVERVEEQEDRWTLQVHARDRAGAASVWSAVTGPSREAGATQLAVRIGAGQDPDRRPATFLAGAPGAPFSEARLLG